MDSIVIGVTIGVVTGVILAIGSAIRQAWIDRGTKDKVKALVEVLARAVPHRAKGSKELSNPGPWIGEARELEDELAEKARRLSLGSGAVITWLNEVRRKNIPGAPQEHQVIEANLNAAIGRVGNQPTESHASSLPALSSKRSHPNHQYPLASFCLP